MSFDISKNKNTQLLDTETNVLNFIYKTITSANFFNLSSIFHFHKQSEIIMSSRVINYQNT